MARAMWPILHTPNLPFPIWDLKTMKMKGNDPYEACSQTASLP